MKTVKKAFAILLAISLIFALGMNIFAVDNGTITVNGTTAGKVYNIYKIFDLTYAETEGSTPAVSYTIDPDWEEFFAGDGAAYIVADNNEENTLSPITVDGDVKYINITSTNIKEFSQAALDAATAMEVDATKTAEGAQVVFSNLALGYYLVYPEGASIIAANASICSLNSTTPDAEVDVKASYPTIEKKVNDTNPDIGQTVTYSITGKVPDTTGFTSYTYTVSDELSGGLTFNASVANFSAKVGESTPITVTPDYTKVTNGFVVTIDVMNLQDHVGEVITITYSAVVNASAVIGTEGNKNKATLEYSNDPYDEESTTTTPPVDATVYTGAIEINKVDGADDTVALSGATFVLQNAAGKYYSFTAAAGNAAESVAWVDTIEGATTVTSDDAGKAYFKGLEDGTYYLVETVAPEGYNLLTDPVSVDVDYTEQQATVFQIAKVENNSGSVLPTTGGIGTTIFYIIGGLLVATAVVLFATKKKMSASKG